MLPGLLFVVILLAGCGLWSRDEVVESGEVQEVVVGTTSPETMEQERDFFGRPMTDQGSMPNMEREVLENEMEREQSGEGEREEELNRIDKTQEIVRAITEQDPSTAPQPAQQQAQEKPRVSPVTGPAIPENEMRKILNDELIANGQSPRY